MAQLDDTKRKPTVNRANRQKKSTDAVIELRKHMRTCRKCIAARKSLIPHDMCSMGMMMVLQTSILLEDAIRMRLQASADKNGFFYPCPSPEKHGLSWAQTVTPLMATGVQDRIF